MRLDDMDFIDEYFDLQHKIHSYFGYQEDWCVIPLVDHRHYHWILFEDSEGTGYIHYSDEPFEDGYDVKGDYYSSSIYTQRFLPTWVYRTEKHTLVCMDTHCDGNKFLGIFDNSKEQKDIKP